MRESRYAHKEVTPLNTTNVNAAAHYVPHVSHAGYREWRPFIGPHDPCPPVYVKTYVVPPNQYIPYQPMNLPQYSLAEALKAGTLWPALYSPYHSKCSKKGR
ncbi:spore coat associated protein CotJA [Paenibacillus sp. MMS18-CY102]|nr:spore coat associated protein CotJA [Paenibacillus sp. MMS18-CY102]